MVEGPAPGASTAGRANCLHAPLLMALIMKLAGLIRAKRRSNFMINAGRAGVGG